MKVVSVWSMCMTTLAAALFSFASVSSASPQEAQRDAERASVMLVCSTNQEKGMGFIFGVDTDNAYIATAGHVVAFCARDGHPVLVTLKGAASALNGRALKSSEAPLDLGVVSIPRSKLAGTQAALLPSERLGDPEGLSRGDGLFVVADNWFTNVTPELLASRDGATLLFESHITRPGSSGGPLLNDRWQIVGMVRKISDAAAEAISIDSVLGALNSWKMPVQIRLIPVISAGDDITCRLSRRGEARCWADEFIGKSSIKSAEIQTFSAGLPFQTIAAGGDHACALTLDGAAYCLGSDKQGQLGDGSKAEQRDVPVRVSGGLKFASISAGGWHTCAITVDEQAYCWGAGEEGRLGNDAGDDSTIPVLVAGGLRFRSLSGSSSPRNKAYHAEEPANAGFLRL